MVAGTFLDHSVGIATESTYNTPVTVTRFYEWNPGATLDFDPMPIQGKGLRAGSKFIRSGRRLAGIGQGKGVLPFDLESKGFGQILNNAFGTATSTLVSGSTWQQVFTATTTGITLPSFTTQEGIVNSAGTVDTYTYAGCTATAIEFDCPTGGYVGVKVTLDTRSVATGVAYATPSLPVASNIFTFVGGAVTMAGSVTVPTTTALATGGTAVANVKNFNLKLDNGSDVGRWIIGGRNQPSTGARTAKLKCDIEYSDQTLVTAYLAQSAFAITLTFQTPTALSSGFETFQICIPAAMINSGPMPQPKDDNVIVNATEFEVVDNLVAAQALYAVLRTADSAL